MKFVYSLARHPCPLHQLSTQERGQYQTLGHPHRQQSWLLGRAALKALLMRLGEPPETSHFVFPSPWLSLTHYYAPKGLASVALAVACPPPLRHACVGLGIDYEPRHRLIAPAAERFYLTSAESAWLAAQPHPAMARLHLWTVKEACLKADVQNVGKVYRHYQLRLPAMAPFFPGVSPGASWRATLLPWDDSPQDCQVRSVYLGEGVLSVAWRTKGVAVAAALSDNAEIESF
jgi:hypothetical protein